MPAFFAALLLAPRATATASAELYTSTSYHYGRFEARVRFAAGDGVVSSFFLWKDGSDKAGTFWNELDYEKLGADCHVQTNALFGDPVGDHSEKANLSVDPCGGYHVYAYEWLPDSITWLVDGVQIRQETGDVATAYADNAPNGMQLHFNIWPGDSSFGGNFSPSILPVHQYIDWVQYSAYENGTFTLTWRQDFDGSSLPSGWSTGNWSSPKNLSTHDPRNVNFIDGYAVLSLTADDATGPAGAMPDDDGGMSGGGGAPGGGAGSGNAGGGFQAFGGSPATAGSPAIGGSSATAGSSAMGGSPGTGGLPAVGGSPGVGGFRAIGGSSAGPENGGSSSAHGGVGGAIAATAGVSAAGGRGGSPVGPSSPTSGSTGGAEAAGTTASGGATSDRGFSGAQGCGCRQVGSRRGPPGGFLTALTLGTVCLSLGRRRRASVRIASRRP